MRLYGLKSSVYSIMYAQKSLAACDKNRDTLKVCRGVVVIPKSICLCTKVILNIEFLTMTNVK